MNDRIYSETCTHDTAVAWRREYNLKAVASELFTGPWVDRCISKVNKRFCTA